VNDIKLLANQFTWTPAYTAKFAGRGNMKPRENWLDESRVRVTGAHFKSRRNRRSEVGQSSSEAKNSISSSRVRKVASCSIQTLGNLGAPLAGSKVDRFVAPAATNANRVPFSACLSSSTPLSYSQFTEPVYSTYQSPEPNRDDQAPGSIHSSRESALSFNGWPRGPRPIIHVEWKLIPAPNCHC
jgi:hypothetical protein